MLPLIGALGSIFKSFTGLMQGFGMGAGYGSGVRFGYEDLYPLFKDNVTALGRAIFPVPYAESGLTGAYQTKAGQVPSTADPMQSNVKQTLYSDSSYSNIIYSNKSLF